MRTNNLILSIALITLTTSAFGQFSSFRERVLHNRNDESPFKTAEYSGRTSQFKAFLSDVFTLERDALNLDVTAEPVVLECYTYDHVDISYQEEMNVESWMSTPFVNSEVVPVESWMTEPFDTGEVIEVEGWMAASWQ